MANIHLHTTRKMEKTKHTKYFSRCLFLLPAQATSYDGNRLSIVYFCLSGLDLLGTLDQFIKTDEQRKEYIEWIYKQVVESGEGFRGSPTFKLCGHEHSESREGDNSEYGERGGDVVMVI
jgi:geranylgeranyl transferase type-1 subunit beta